MRTTRAGPRCVRAAFVAVAAAVGLVACSDGAVTQNDRLTVRVSPEATIVAVGTSMTLTAEVTHVGGQPAASYPVYWSSSDTAVAVVSDAGVVTTKRAGEVQIAATVQGISATATIVVSEAPPVATTATRVTVSPTASVIRASGPQSGRRVDLTARAFDADNTAIDVDRFEWRSSNPDVATVDAAGRVTGRSSGSATISATVGGKSGTALVMVIR